MSTFDAAAHPRTQTPGVAGNGQFTTKAKCEADVDLPGPDDTAAAPPKSLALHASGVHIHDRNSGKDYGVHDECLTALQALSPTAWDPFKGDWVVIGPVVGDFTCAYNACQVAKG